mgnify:CR=1 FL=1|jgi:uncharacterized membrane protein YfcA
MLSSILAGIAAGAVNGLFGAGGGMVLVPSLRASGGFSERELFRCSIIMILPMSLITLLTGSGGDLPWRQAWPYLLGAVPGGILAALTGRRIPTKWLHRFLGVMILYGGTRYLC